MSDLSDQAVADLDAALASDGETVELQRLVGTQLIPIRVACRAFVRSYDARELVGGITQDQSRVIISPSEIIRAGWPGPDVEVRNAAGVVTTALSQQDRRVPRRGDKVVIAGKPRNIEVAMPIYVDGALVRIDLRVLG